MENAPLTLAHAHARSAADETYKANSSAASAEHEQAAGEFSKAAGTTQDSEALRILHLLEDHHLHLSRAIKAQTRAAAALAAAEQDKPTDTASPSTPASGASTVRPNSPVQARSPPRTRRRPPRDLSSSIASNLASARGIPGAQQRRGAPASPTVTAHNVSRDRQRQLSPGSSSAVETTRRQLRGDHDSSVPRSIVPLPSQPEDQEKTAQPPRSQNDAAFNRFYSNFEGLLSTLTAPLVFAGFPLGGSSTSTSNVSAQPETPPVPKQQRPKRTPAPQPPASSLADPDQLKSLISRAAIRALKDTRGLAAQESFYVVPTSGGTVSYAGILTRDPNQPPGSDSIGDGDITDTSGRALSVTTSLNEEFVDASENPQPLSPGVSRTSRDERPGGPTRENSKLGAGATTGGPGRFATPTAGGKVVRSKTLEELELETQKQRETIDLLSRRLLMWETSSQRSAMALAESMRSNPHHHHHHHHHPHAPTHTRRTGGALPPALSRDSSAKTVDSNATATSPSDDIPPVPPLPGKEPAAAARTQDAAAIADPDELRELLTVEKRDRERLAKENEKLVAVLGRYREKWEELKAGAKARVAAREKAAQKGKEGGGVEESA